MSDGGLEEDLPDSDAVETPAPDDPPQLLYNPRRRSLNRFYCESVKVSGKVEEQHDLH